MPRRIRPLFRTLSAIGISLGFITLAAPAGAQLSGEALVNSRCSGCHERMADGKLSRVGEIRKTPEGWDMNIARMMIMHGVEVTSEERSALVKYLSDNPDITERLRDVHIWTRADDGSWKLAVDVWNSLVPLED